MEELREVARLAASLGPAALTGAHDELIRAIAEGARGLLQAEACSIALLEGDELVFTSVAGGAEAEVTGLRIPADRGIAGWVVSSGQAIAIQDPARDPRFAGDVAESVGYTPSSILAMPLETDRRTLGVIEVLDAHGGGPGEAGDLETLALIARQASLAIEGRQAFAQLADLLLAALRHAAEGTDLPEALDAVAHGTTPELAELAGLLARLGRLGEKEQRAAVRIVRELVAYAEGGR